VAGRAASVQVYGQSLGLESQQLDGVCEQVCELARPSADVKYRLDSQNE